MSNKEKKILLAEQIDDFYATIMRQAYFTIFEVSAHDSISKNNATTIDELSDLYLSNLKEQFGDSVKVTDDFKYEWLIYTTYISLAFLLLCIFIWQFACDVFISTIQN